MKQLIKNYTTEVPVDRTVGEIQRLLAENGARGIALEYDDQGKLTNIFFKISLNDRELPFRLPAKPDQVYNALHGGATRDYHSRYGDVWRRDAERIAWRICKTWLEAQITLINLEQAKIEEIFLPYLVTQSNRTLYEVMKDNQFLLPSGS